MEDSISKTIKARRATPARFLAKDEISREVVEKLFENANWAPNHKQTEPWRFQVYSGSAKKMLANEIHTRLLEKINSGEPLNLQKAHKFKSDLEHVPVAIAIILQRDAAERIPEWEEVAAVSMAVQNMWLTATELGLGAFWATPQFLPQISDVLHLEPRQKMLGFFYVGKIAMEYPSPGRGDVADKVKWME